jgi:regulator of protease activity HflC (stomatin/prohibitin superfamily)
VQEVRLYPISQQEYTMSAVSDEGSRFGNDAVDATTIDGQSVALDVTIFYSINPLQVNLVHERWRDTYETYVRSTARTVVRDVVASFRAEAIYGEGRIQMQEEINEVMAVELAREGLMLNTLDVRGLSFSEQFRQAIEERITAEQRAQQARFVVQQREQEAEQARVTAAGARDAAVARAEGEARSIILRAEAEAQALRLVSEQLAANPSLIQYQYVQNLSDNVQLVMVPSNTPFLFDTASLGIPNPNFVAPEVPQTEDTTTTPPATTTPGG